MTRFIDTDAADLDLTTVSGVAFKKLEELEELNLTIVDARIVKSTFKGQEDKDAAQVTFVFAGEDIDTDVPYQFTSQQAAIMQGVRIWLQKHDEFPIEDVTVRNYGENFYGKPKYCFAAFIPDDEPPEVRDVDTNLRRNGTDSNMRPSQRDLREDTSRSRLSGHIPGRPSPKGR